MKEESFNSKILLFGEYTVIINSNALSIPFRKFHGKLKTSSKNLDLKSNREIKSLLNYLKSLDQNEVIFLDLDSLEFDLRHGLYFESSIPSGYGLGSSGALTAAIYNKYCNHSAQDSILNVKKELSIIESHFHGNSSGLDPLVSYYDDCLKSINNDVVERVCLPEFKNKTGGALFLLDTGKSRSTEPLVNLFYEKLKDEKFEYFCRNKLATCTNECIEQILDADVKSLFNSFDQLSNYQWENFSPMIPKTYNKLWEEGLRDRNFSLKLCGAGGGGFLIGMSSNFKKFSNQYPKLELSKIIDF